MNVELLSALAIGFFGSFHCIGMCGPIAIALPVPNSSNISFFAGRILYNIGRIVTYSFLGAIFGLIGSGFYIAGFQQSVSVAIGLIILIYLFIPFEFKKFLRQLPVTEKVKKPIQRIISELFSKNTLPVLFLIGLLNGLLPCGFVYVAIGGAVAAGDAITGSAFMMLFGFGTVPAMFAASVFGKFINLNIRRKINRTIPVFAAILAIIFILRGLNLGIPYLSPNLVQPDQISNLNCN
ncbi:MAG: sulfite exporter TauE/SafE family protein [Ignavibacteriaceae bacterium]